MALPAPVHVPGPPRVDRVAVRIELGRFEHRRSPVTGCMRRAARTVGQMVQVPRVARLDGGATSSARRRPVGNPARPRRPFAPVRAPIPPSVRRRLHKEPAEWRAEALTVARRRETATTLRIRAHLHPGTHQSPREGRESECLRFSHRGGMSNSPGCSNGQHRFLDGHPPPYACGFGTLTFRTPTYYFTSHKGQNVIRPSQDAFSRPGCRAGVRRRTAASR
jgi:hypothetical protein